MENEYMETISENNQEIVDAPGENNAENDPGDNLENPENSSETDSSVDSVEDFVDDVSSSDVRTDDDTVSGNIFFGEDINNNVLGLSEKVDAINGNLETLAKSINEPFWSKEFNSFTTTEGILFILLLLIALSMLWKLITDRKGN